MITKRLLLVLAATAALALFVAACGGDDSSSSDSAASNGSSGSSNDLSGTIRVDGSSTVGPLTEAVAEKFQAENPGVKVTVGTSGTGGGFEKFCAGETDISDASRPIKPEEAAACKKKSIGYGDVHVATDALAILINNQNPVKCMTVDQLKQVWNKGSTVNNWSQISGLEPPYDQKLALFGPGTTSGTFDYFTDAINGEEDVSRTDYNNVGEDDNQTVRGVEGAPGGMGYAGYSYLKENEGKIKAVEVKNPDSGQCVAPSVQTGQDGSYAPLSRPLFVYPSDAALKKPEVKAFLEYYVDNVNSVAEQVGFIPLTDEQLAKSKTSLQKVLGT
jgi:phosphate transport system substrate-binding protein